MMDRKPKKELIEGIRDALRDFEEPYNPKEWENFQRQRKVKKHKSIPLFVKLTGVAACLSLMVYASVRILSVTNGTHKADSKITKQTLDSSVTKKQKVKDTLALDSVSSSPPAFARETLAGQPPNLAPNKRLRNWTTVTSPSDTISSSNSQQFQKPVPREFSAIPPLSDLQESETVLPEKLGNLMDSQFSKVSRLGKALTNKKHINPGFNIDLGISGEGLLFGGGGSVQIPLSGRLLAEVGVNYSRINVGTDMEVDRPDTTSQQKIGVRHTVGMVSLPISLNYMISDGFSVALGIKPFIAVTDQRTDIFQYYEWLPPDISSNDSTGRLISERHELKQPDSLYKKKAYWGFIQLSGYISPPVLKKYNAVIAPYIAIPIGKLQNDPYRWIHGGISVRVYLSRP